MTTPAGWPRRSGACSSGRSPPSVPARRSSSGTTPSRRSPCCWRSAPPRKGGWSAPPGPLPALRGLQAACARGVLDPAAGGTLAGRIVAGGLDPGRRLAVYRDNVLVSLSRLLEGTFPATRHHLCPERFAGLALAFVRTEPPDRPQLLAYGAGFPAFLARADV